MPLAHGYGHEKFRGPQKHGRAAVLPSFAVVDDALGLVIVATFSVTATDLVVNITAPAGYVGTYLAPLSSLALGPVNIIAPVVTGTIGTGNVATASAGVWVYDLDQGTPTITRQWERADGTPIAGQTGTTYTQQAFDAALGVSIRETASNTAGSADVVTVFRTITVYVELPVKFTGANTHIYNASGLSASADSIWGFAKGKMSASGSGSFFGFQDYLCRVSFSSNQISCVFFDTAVNAVMVYLGAATIPTDTDIALLFKAGNNGAANSVWAKIGTAAWASLYSNTSPALTNKLNIGGAYRIGMRDGSAGDTFTFSRFVAYLNSAAPDFSLPSVQQVFLASGGGIADPAMSVAVYGQAALDVYGPASAVNAFATANRGTGPAYTAVSGAATDA